MSICYNGRSKRNSHWMDSFMRISRKKWIAIVAGIGLVFAIEGCADKADRELYRHIHQRAPELKTLQQSEKVLFPGKEGNTTIVIATYLPDPAGRRETFVTALYPKSAVAVEHFTLQGQKPVEIREIRRSDLPPEVAETIPAWFGIYRLRFAEQQGKRLMLHVPGPEGNSRDIPFYKGPKYLVTHPKFK